MYLGDFEEVLPKINKPVTPIEISVNPDIFSMKDFPSLVKQLVETHNTWINETYSELNQDFKNTILQSLWRNLADIFTFHTSGSNLISDEQKQLWQMNTGLVFAKKFLAIVQILDEALQSSPLDIKDKNLDQSEIKSEIKDLKNQLEEIAGNYGLQNTDEILSHPKREKILNFVKKILSKKDSKIESRLPKLIKIISNNIKIAINESFGDSLYDRSTAELMRLTDLDSLLKDFDSYMQQLVKQKPNLESGLNVGIEHFQKELEAANDKNKKAENKGSPPQAAGYSLLKQNCLF